MTPIPEMIEAAARALCALEGHDPDYPASHFDDGRELIWEGWKADAEAALTAALSAAWQPIESVPLNEEAVLICTVDGIVGEARHFDPGGWYWAGFDPTDYHDGAVVEPTHYQTLPSPPESKT